MIVVNELWKTYTLDRRHRQEAEPGTRDRVLHAVAGVNFVCRPGRVFTLLGPNGAGKTTALRMIATLLRPTKGTVSVEGSDTVRQSREVRRKIGYLSGSTKLYERLTPDELVKYYADLHGMEREHFQARRREVFDLLGIQEFAQRRIGKLSTGMKQKVSIARTIIHDPPVVVFDEPTVGLDVITSRHIIDLIRSCKAAGKTVIFSTHIMGEVSLLSDDLAIIHNGKLRFSGSYDEFRSGMRGTSLEEEFIRHVTEGQP
jgi:sodium transport system ATP-binding protein